MSNVIALSWPKNTKDFKSTTPEVWAIDHHASEPRQTQPSKEALRDYLTAPVPSDKPLDRVHLLHNGDTTPTNIADFLGVKPDDVTARFVNIDDLHRASHLPKELSKEGTPLPSAESLFKSRLLSAKESHTHSAFVIDRLTHVFGEKPQGGDYDPNFLSAYKRGREDLLEYHGANLNTQETFLKSTTPAVFEQNFSHGKLLAMGYLQLKQHFEAPFENTKQQDDTTVNPGSVAFAQAAMVSDQFARMKHETPRLQIDIEQARALQESSDKQVREDYQQFLAAVSNYPPARLHLMQNNYGLMSAETNRLVGNSDFKAIRYPQDFKDLLLSPLPMSHQPAVNENWFQGMKGGHDMNNLTSVKSKEATFLKELQLPDNPSDDKNQEEKARLSYVQSLLQLRRSYVTLEKSNEPINKLIEMSDDATQGVAIDITAFGARTGRHTSGGGLNFQALPKDVKNLLVPHEGDTAITFDAKQMEVRVAANLFGLQALQDTIQQDKDPYLFLAAQTELKKQNRHSNPGSWDIANKAGEMANILQNPHQHDPALVAQTEEQRKTAKTLVIATIYGQGAQALSQKNGWPLADAQQHLKAFRQDNPQIQQNTHKISEFLKQGVVLGHSQLTLGSGEQAIYLSMGDNRTHPTHAMEQQLSDPRFAVWFEKTYLVGEHTPPTTPKSTDLKVVFGTGEQLLYHDVQINNPKGMHPDDLKRDYQRDPLGHRLSYDAQGERDDIYASKLLQNLVQATGANLMTKAHVGMVTQFHEKGIQAHLTLPIHDSLTVVAKSPEHSAESQQAFNSIQDTINHPDRHLGTASLLAFDSEVIKKAPAPSQETKLEELPQYSTDITIDNLGFGELDDMSIALDKYLDPKLVADFREHAADGLNNTANPQGTTPLPSGVHTWTENGQSQHAQPGM